MPMFLSPGQRAPFFLDDRFAFGVEATAAVVVVRRTAGRDNCCQQHLSFLLLRWPWAASAVLGGDFLGFLAAASSVVAAVSGVARKG